MANPMNLRNPIQTLNAASNAALLSLSRPLTEADYIDATKHSKYQKRYDDGFSLGSKYLCRHSKRNWQAGHKTMASLQGALVPVAATAWATSTVALSLPGMLVVGVQALVPTRRRSELGTREDVIGKAVFKFSRVLNAFAVSQQYHDNDFNRPMDNDDMRRALGFVNLMIRLFDGELKKAAPEIKNSKNIIKSTRYLYRMQDVFAERRVPDRGRI